VSAAFVIILFNCEDTFKHGHSEYALCRQLNGLVKLF